MIVNSSIRRRRPAPVQAPAPTFSQEELRERRRHRLPLAYDGSFDLAAEITAIVSPLAGRVAGLPQPLFARVWVVDVAEAVHELVGTVIGWTAEADALARTGHLADDPGKRTHAVKLYRDLAQRPALPDITDDMLISGSWAAVLVRLGRPHSGPLAELLTRSRPPNHEALRGQPSRSERLETLLRQTVDRVARSLQHYVERRESERPKRARAQTDEEQARRELAALGVHLDDDELQEVTP